MITLKVRRQPAITREEFLRSHLGYAIALDGYVADAPFIQITPKGPFRNFDHHVGVDRSCTSSTCEQVRRAVLLGLYELFQDDDEGRRADIYVNDCDQDVCLASWILMNPERAAEYRVQRLSQVEDLLDM